MRERHTLFFRSVVALIDPAANHDVVSLTITIIPAEKGFPSTMFI
jgi:hypothetical protein